MTKKQGILFIIWGWLLLFNSITEYIKRRLTYSFLAEDIFKILKTILPVLIIAFTGYYLFEKRKNKRDIFTQNTLYYLWISLIVCMILVNLIQYNVLHQINFELQHPLFMVLTAFAIVMTGVILHFPFILLGGALFGLLALAASNMELPEQLLIESLAWLIAFIIPGYMLDKKIKLEK